MMVTSVEDLRAFQKARDLNKSLYKLIQNKPFLSNRAIIDQLQRASSSVVLNIAEGFDSGSDKSFCNFLKYSYRSLGEIKSILLISLDLNYITKAQYDFILEKIIETRKIIWGLMKYLTKK